MMKLFTPLQFLILALVFVWAAIASGQSCTATNPCVQVSITNPNALPSSTVLLECSGGSCTAASLTSYLATQTATNLCPAVSSIWKCTTFSQTKTPQLYNDAQPWGIMVSYATQGTSGGGVSGVSQITTFQVPPAPPQQTTITGVPTMVTSGTSGPQ